MFDTKSTQRTGNDGFYWFIGVIEDIKDPLQIGRVRVRAVGDHTQSKSLIPTNTLPWAPIMNNDSSNMNGIGESDSGKFVQGTWVIGFYADGPDKQTPIVMGSIGGVPEAIPWDPRKADEEDNELEEHAIRCGFQDPDNQYPMGRFIFEQDTNRLARNDPGDHIAEIPWDEVPIQEIFIKKVNGGWCPLQPHYAIKHVYVFDDNYVRYYAKGDKKNIAVMMLL